MKKHRYLGLIAAGMLAVTACGTPAVSPAGAPAEFTFPSSIQIEDNNNDVISVVSKEEVFVVPDIAEIVFSIRTEEKTAKQCQQSNTETLHQVLEFLKSKNIEETSIQTSAYSLNPIYDWSKGQTLKGYEMITRITVSDIPLDQSGALITEAVENGVNNIDSVSYLSSKYDDSYQEALEKAVANARRKAEALAAAGGRTLSEMVHVEEYTPNTAVRYARNSVSYEAVKESAAGAAMDVMPGQVKVEAQVTVEFSLQ